MEKKQIKMSLGTFIVSVIAIILVVVIVIMAIQMSNQNKALEESQIAMANKENELQKETTTKVTNTPTPVPGDKGTELNINDSIVQKLIDKTDSFIPILYKNKTLDNEVKFMYALMDLYTNGSFENSWDYENNTVVLSKDDVRNAIINRFGKNVKYTDQSYQRTNLAKFDCFFGGMGPFIYENGNYYIANVVAGDGWSEFSVVEKVNKVLKYDNKIDIYVKAGYESFNSNGLTEGDFLEMDENAIKAKGVTTSIYQDYDFNTNTPKNKLIEQPGNQANIEEVLNQLDTYVYTFEKDLTGEYYLSGFSKRK